LTDLPAVDSEVLDNVEFELLRQIHKWGVQNHPDHTGAGWNLAGYNARPDTNDAEAMAELFKQINDKHVTRGTLSWSVILQEEMYEALAESDPDALATELVQVAAVAVAWVRDIRMRQRGLWDRDAA
jgi:hypothetical protein